MQDTSAQNEDQQDSDEDFEDAYEWNVEGSDAVSSLEKPEEDDELQVVDEIDIIEQELFPQEEGGCVSTPTPLSSSIELSVSNYQVEDAHVDKNEPSLSSLVLQP
eukprot:Em0019g431a